MANVLIVNSGKDFLFSKGELNNFLTKIAHDELITLGHLVKVTVIDNGYDAKEEVNQFLWADVIIYQQPAWWMQGPWILKKYIDDVFTEGTGILYANDGRTRSDLSKKYGSGGLCQNKRYMISATWNAPLEAFNEIEQFFEGKGIDSVYFSFHKANQFLGMKPLPTFLFNDVIKQPEIERDVERYKLHLRNI